MLELVLGGARSGKSGYAESVVRSSGLDVVYIATALVQDDEMCFRIEQHRSRRPDEWLTVEEPVFLAKTLLDHAAVDRILLVDCLTLWLSNCLFHEDHAYPEDLFALELGALMHVLPVLSGRCVLVSNEVGMGIVPENAAARRFRDEAGLLNQAVAELSDRVVWVAAGLPQVLKAG